jgi:hypothetical protein
MEAAAKKKKKWKFLVSFSALMDFLTLWNTNGGLW